MISEVTKMAKKKKNKALPLIIMAAVLAVLLAGYLILSHINAKKAEEEANTDTSTIEVLKKSPSILTAFSYTVGGEKLEFSYINDVWEYPADSTFPVDSSAVAKMVSGLTDIKAVSVVDTEGAEVKEFGLEKPELLIEATYSDGTEYTLTFGIVNNYNSYQYMTVSGNDNIYLVESTVASPFGAELNDLYKNEIWKLQNDAVTAEDVTSVVLETKDGEKVTVEYPETVEKLFNMVYKLNLSTWEDHYADEAEMKNTYGIYPQCDRVTLNYTKETSVTNKDGTASKVEVPAAYTVYFGYEFEVVEEAETSATEEKKEPEMKFFYTQAGSSVVYSASKELSDDIFEYLSYVPPVETQAE